MRFTIAAIVAGALLAPSIGAVQAQTAGSGPSSARCSSIAEVEPSHAAALIYYIAGYSDAIRDAQTQLGGGTTEGGAAAEENVAEGVVTGTAGAGNLLTLTLSADSVISACAQSPDSLISDIITSQGGSGVSPSSAPNANEGATQGPNTDPDAAPAQ